MSSTIMPESKALQKHLNEYSPENNIKFFSGFIAALNDARNATNRDKNGKTIKGKPHGNWLGAIGYMALLDQIGSCFKSKTSAAVCGNTINKALKCFSSLSDDEINAIYALRCAFAHDFSLYNINKKNADLTHHFFVCEGKNGPLVAFPQKRWDGNYQNMTKDNTTSVNIEALGDLVENICSKIRSLAINSDLEITLLGGSDELLKKYSFITKLS